MARSSDLFCLLMLIVGIQNSFQVCVKYDEIEEENFNRQYTAINDATGATRPLGFLRSTVVYQSELPNPCFSISGQSGQYLELKYETVPTMQLCVKEMETGEIFCDQGRHSMCRAFTSTTMRYEFYCEKGRGCAEADVNFWFRLQIGPTPAEDTEGMWCHNLKSEYPETLRTFPINFSPPPSLRTVNSSGSQLNSVMLLLLIVAAFAGCII